MPVGKENQNRFILLGLQKSVFWVANSEAADLALCILRLALVSGLHDSPHSNNINTMQLLEAFCVNLKALVRTSAERTIVEIQYLRPWLISQGGLRGSFDA